MNLESIVSLCKRRGFIFPSSESYGGVSSIWDYGPLGMLLKKNIQNVWWQFMLRQENIYPLDTAIFMSPSVWEASGHVDNFYDKMVDCTKCQSRFRLDQLADPHRCPHCGTQGSFTQEKEFNLMFETHLGSTQQKGSQIYLRPETAQGIFMQFKNVLNCMRTKLPFGVAQVGKAFRNEITTKSFIFRTCEFEQMEMEFFIPPGQQAQWMEYWQQQRWEYYCQGLGLEPTHLRVHPHAQADLAHYADRACDIEFAFPMGFGEIEGIHSRTDFDLKRHAEFSKKPQDFMYNDLVSGEKYFPYVIETSAGLTRTVLAVLCQAYWEQKLEQETRIVLRLKPSLAPYTVAIFPLMKKPDLVEKARKVFEQLRKKWSCCYDESGAIGKRYRRHDEIGTPYALTIDYDSLETGRCTIRFRDSMEQKSISLEGISEYIQECWNQQEVGV